MKIGVVDAGTNSFLLLMAKKENSGINYFFDTSTIVGLGHLVNGKIREENLKKAFEVIRNYKALCQSHGIEKIAITGTEIFRKMDKTYFQKISEGFDEVRILTGEEESWLSYRSVVEDDNFSNLKNPLVIDIGGGSFEMAKYTESEFRFESIPMGAVMLTDRFVKEYPVAHQLDDVDDQLKVYLSSIPSGPIVSIGGTGTTVASIIEERPFDPTVIHGKFLKIEDLAELLEKMKKMSLEKISKINGMEKGREKIIIAGLFLIVEILKYSHASGLYISVRGHRYAVARDMLDGAK
ncbi:MAG: hypothetical protein M1521_02620 [Thermotogae bacterium]|nr:hypothetical protein [Thermotogota bacterium]